MPKIKIYNCLKSGATREERNVKSSYAQNRTLLIQDPINKKIWLMHGNSVDTETKRLAYYSADEMKQELNFPLEVIEPDEFEEKTKYFLNIEKEKVLAKKEVKAIDRSIVQKHIEPEMEITEEPFPKKKPSKKVIDPSKKPEKITIKPKKKSKKLPVEKSVEELRGSIPSPSKTNLPDKIPDEKPLLKADMSTMGPVIEDFQIMYYEKSGGSNYILVEELDKAINDSADFMAITDHISLINDLVHDSTNKEQASKALGKSLENLINKLF